MEENKQKEQTQEIQKQESQPQVEVIKDEDRKIVPDAKNLWHVAKGLYESRMFPNVNNPYGAMAIIEYGRELGLKPVISLQTMCVIEGKICIESKSLMAMALQKGINIKIEEKTREKSVVTFKRKNQDPWTETFTFDDAKKAGICISKSGNLKYNWRQYPEEMCFWRCIAKGLRAYAPDAILGLYTKEEMLDAEGQTFQTQKEDKPKEKPKTQTKKKASPKKKTTAKKKPGPKKTTTKKETKTTQKKKEPEPAQGTESERLESVVGHFQEDFQVKYGENDWRNYYQKFKKFLFNLQKEEFKGKRTFVQFNQYGKLSLTEGNVDDLEVLWSQRQWVFKKFEEWLGE